MKEIRRVIIPTVYKAECPTIRSRLLPLCRELVPSGYHFTFFVIGCNQTQEVEYGIFYRGYRNYIELVKYILSLSQENTDVIYACKAYSITGFLSLLVAKVRKLNYILDVDDRIFPSEINKWWRLPLYLQEWLSERVLKLLKPTTTAASIALAKHMGNHAIYIPNSADLNKFTRKNWNSYLIKEQYGIVCPVIIWPAVFFQETDRCYILEVFKNCMELQADVVLLVLGDGEYLPVIKQNVSAMKLKNIVFAGSIPYNDMPHYYASATAGILPLRNNHYDACKGPIKLFEYMAMELPVIATKIGEPEYIVSNANCGILIPFDKPKIAASMIIELIESPKCLNMYGKNGRHYIEKHLLFSHQAESLLKIINNKF